MIPEHPTEMYVGTAVDLYRDDVFMQSSFYVYIREMNGATPVIMHGLVDTETLKKLTIKYEDLVSKNVLMSEGELMLLNTVSRVSRNISNDFEVPNTLQVYKEDYAGTIWWILDILNQMEAEIHLTEQSNVPISSMRFSKSTMTLYYSYLKDEINWSSFKLLWYTDKLHLADNIKIRVKESKLNKHPEYPLLKEFIKSETSFEFQGERTKMLDIDLSKAKVITKTTKDIMLYTIKEFIIKDVLQSELASLKISGATMAKHTLEKMMEIQTTSEFKEYTATSGIKQVNNLKFNMYYNKPRKIQIDYLMDKEEYKQAILNALETGDDSELDIIVDKLIEDYGLNVYTRDFSIGFVNSIRANDEGFFDYKLHNYNMSMYRKESFNANLNLHKERMQMFLHQYSFGDHINLIEMEGGEYKLKVTIEKEGY